MTEAGVESIALGILTEGRAEDKLFQAWVGTQVKVRESLCSGERSLSQAEGGRWRRVFRQVCGGSPPLWLQIPVPGPLGLCQLTAELCSVL